MSKKLDFANQQLLGYYAGKWNNLLGMIEEMDLTHKEWIILKNDYEPNLDECDYKEIDEYFASLHEA